MNEKYKRRENMKNKSQLKTKNSKFKTILVTGGSGFIGSNFIKYIFKKTDFKGKIVNIDKLTYAANPLNLKDIARKYSDRYFFERVDVCDYDSLIKVFKKYNIDTVVHFAAESHVDRSILGPKDFVQTNIIGTFNLLEAAKKHWFASPNNKSSFRFHHISTDEVYGSLGKDGFFYEDTAYNPRSPYSASKASSDHLVRAYYHTYNFPVSISNCSNNYGPYQFPEKLIPLVINNALEGKAIPIYGDGENIRDWLYVEDHCSAILTILSKGKIGETYNIGGGSERTNLDIVNKICELLDEKYPLTNNSTLKSYKNLITFVTDRPGHDRRYAINCDKIKRELGWKQNVSFDEGIEKTVKWYLDNQEWTKSIKNGDYLEWIEKNYGKRQ